MRSAAVILVLVLGVGWGAVRNLPEREADADVLAVPAGDPARIQSIAIDGHNLPIEQLRDVLASHAGDHLDVNTLARDQLALEHALVMHGYLAAKVEPAQVTHDATGAFVTFTVVRGRLFHVRSVTVTGPASADAGVVTIAPGAVALADQLEHARAAMTERLAVRGKRASVTLTVTPDVAAAIVDVVLAAR